LLWYISDPTWPDPNFTLLNNALAQTGWGEGTLTSENWRAVVRTRIAGLDWARVVEDVRPFLEQPAEVAMLTRENILALLAED